jgi:uncharacterized protein DUF5317
MLASALGLGIVGGLAFGGRVSHLRTFHLAWLPLLAIAVAIRLLAPLAGGSAVVAYVVAFAAIAAVAVRNRAIAGTPLIATGAALNLVVVALNGGMPVSVEAAQVAGAVMPTDPLHLTSTAGAALGLLGDIIPLAPLHAVYSIGDVLIALGGAALAFRSVRP